MTDEIRHKKFRPFFAVVAGVALAGLIVMIGIIVVGLRRAQPGEGPVIPIKPLPPRPAGVVITNVLYINDGDAIRYDHMTIESSEEGGTLMRPAGEKTITLTGVDSDVPAPSDLGAVTRIMKEILQRVGAMDKDYPTLAISPRGMEVAFTIANDDGNSLLRRRPDGRYEHLTAHGVGMDFQRLNELQRPPETLEERLASPDRWVWMDASLEYLLRHGASVHPIARRLRTVKAQPKDVGELLALFENREAPDLLAESVLLAADAGDESSIGLRVRGIFLNDPKGAVAAFAASYRGGKARRLPDSIRAWLITAIPQVAADDAKALAEGLAQIAEDDDYGVLFSIAQRQRNHVKQAATFVAMRLLKEPIEFDAITDERADTFWETHPPK